MYGLQHTCGFVNNFWFTCKKGVLKANRTKQNKKHNNVVFGPELADFPGVNAPLNLDQFRSLQVRAGRYGKNIIERFV